MEPTRRLAPWWFRLLISGAALSCSPPPESIPLQPVSPRCNSIDPADDEGFIRVCEGTFHRDGQRFPIVGANAYYLQDEASRELLHGHPRSETLQEVLGKLAALNATLVRTWAFNDDPAKPSAIQLGEGQYNEPGLVGLDHVIAEAEAHDLKLLLTLVNYWPEYGGVDQYLRWNGKPWGEAAHRGAFFFDPQLRSQFRQHLIHLVHRRNTVTGRLYRDEPAIMGWELMNEGLGLGATSWLVAAWVQEMAEALREAGVKQLITTGESGFDDLALSPADQWPESLTTVGGWMLDGSKQTSFTLNSQSVDFASIHCYPEHWGVKKELGQKSCESWLRDHGRIARAMGRPVICGEIALTNSELFPEGYYPLEERRAIYRSWLKLAEEGAVEGILPWLFIPDHRPEPWDCCSFGWREGTELADPVNRYADLLAEHGRLMNHGD